MMKLKVGDMAPSFALFSTGGNLFRFNSGATGGKLVLYFYPKDFTPGCTVEACSFRDELSALARLGMEVVGISVDSVISHERFKRELQLPFELLSDTNGDVSRMYGVYNRLLKFSNRVTFVIDGDGKILSITKNMFAPKKHVEAAKSVG